MVRRLHPTGRSRVHRRVRRMYSTPNRRVQRRSKAGPSFRAHIPSSMADGVPLYSIVLLPLCVWHHPITLLLGHDDTFSTVALLPKVVCLDSAQGCPSARKANSANADPLVCAVRIGTVPTY